VTAVLNVVSVLGCLLGVCGFGGMALLLAIQCHHTATEAAGRRKAERRAESYHRDVVALNNSVTRLHGLLAHEADRHAERLADLVSVCGTDTAEPADTRCN
jgi:hypothetical protein